MRMSHRSYDGRTKGYTRCSSLIELLAQEHSAVVVAASWRARRVLADLGDRPSSRRSSSVTGATP